MIVAAAALLLVIFDLEVVGRAPLAVASLLLVPGVPLATALPIDPAQVRYVLGVASGWPWCCWSVSSNWSPDSGRRWEPSSSSSESVCYQRFLWPG